MKNIQITAPFDQHLIREMPISDASVAENMLAGAHQTFLDRDNWLSSEERKNILKKFLVKLEKKQQEFARESAEEGGKPLKDSLIEAARAVSGTEVAIENMGHMTGRHIPMNLSASSANRLAYTYREPVGVVLAISAFNHPLNLIIHQVIPAIAAGCPVIVKPATNTPISCSNVVNLLYEAGLPKTWCQMIICDNEVAESLVCDERISFLSFIGSGKVGWYLRSKLPPGAGCALEHGGAAPVIIEADADLKDALPLLVKGGFYHAGQVCVSVQRVFAEKSIAKSLADNIAASAKKLKVGDPTKPDTDVGPLISPKENDRIADWVKEAIDAGAELLCGGKKISDTCYEPTVLFNPPEDVNVSCQEIFGPVVCVYSYENRAEAIKRANALPFTFQASVFTKNIDVAVDTVKRLKGTAVMINDHTAFRVDWMPFGGREHSGLGLGGIPYSMHDLTTEKMFVLRSPEL